MFTNEPKAYALRRKAQQQDLRNRNIQPDRVMSNIEQQDGQPRCECGNMLTIADSGYRCRQCVLFERMYGEADYRAADRNPRK